VNSRRRFRVMVMARSEKLVVGPATFVPVRTSRNSDSRTPPRASSATWFTLRRAVSHMSIRHLQHQARELRRTNTAAGGLT
jgi:hypothetical protein